MCKKHENNICPECNAIADSKNECNICHNICKKGVNAHNNIAYLFPHAVDEIDENDAEHLAKMTHSRSKKLLRWKCNNSPDHPVYEKSPYQKFIMDRGCPICMKQRNSSKQELRLLAEVRAKFPNALHQVDIQNKKFNVDVLVALE